MKIIKPARKRKPEYFFVMLSFFHWVFVSSRQFPFFFFNLSLAIKKKIDSFKEQNENPTRIKTVHGDKYGCSSIT
jgi:hypothetical protein